MIPPGPLSNTSTTVPSEVAYPSSPVHAKGPQVWRAAWDQESDCGTGLYLVVPTGIRTELRFREDHSRSPRMARPHIESW